MKTKAKKASSDSENIQSDYVVIDMSEFLYLQSTPTCDTLISGFVPYVVVQYSQRPNLQTWFLLFNGLRSQRSFFLTDVLLLLLTPTIITAVTAPIAASSVHLWYLCQILLQIMLSPILIIHVS